MTPSFNVHVGDVVTLDTNISSLQQAINTEHRVRIMTTYIDVNVAFWVTLAHTAIPVSRTFILECARRSKTVTFYEPLAESQGQVRLLSTRGWIQRILEDGAVPHMVESEVSGKLRCLLVHRFFRFFIEVCRQPVSRVRTELVGGVVRLTLEKGRPFLR